MVRRWSFVLPYERPPLSANRRNAHWAPTHKEFQAVKADAHYLAIFWRQKHGLTDVGRVTVTLYWYPGTDRRADSDNISPTIKPYLDGMVAAGIFPDDSAKYVKRTATEVVPYSADPQRRTRPTVILELEEVDDDGAGRRAGNRDQHPDGRVRAGTPERHSQDQAHRPRRPVPHQRHRGSARRARR